MNTPWNPSVLMIGRERLFYSGLAGNSKKPRNLGSFSLYCATEGTFQIAIGVGEWAECEVALVAPYQSHRLVSPTGAIHNLGFEPESLSPAAQVRLGELVQNPDSRKWVLTRVREQRDQLGQVLSQGFMTAEFDWLFLGERLEARQMEPRITSILELMCNDLEDCTVSAEDYAREIFLSPSRFLHLFKLNTGVSFRSLRMWKRARRFLDHASGDNSLTDVALDLGYPDSSHFSHSIRRTYGLKPRSIRQGSRHLKVYPGANYTLAPENWAS